MMKVMKKRKSTAQDPFGDRNTYFVAVVTTQVWWAVENSLDPPPIFA